MNGAARDAECLPRPNVDFFTVDSPGQHPGDAVDRLFIMVVAVRWSRQALSGWNKELKGRDAAIRVGSGEQEPHGERPDLDDLIGRVDVEVDSLLGHGVL